MQKNEKYIKFKEFFVNLYSKNKKMFFVSIVLIIVLIGACFSLFSPGKKQSNKGESKTIVSSYDSYSEMIELKIESLLGLLSGVSKVDAFVILESSPIKNYLTQTEKQTNSSGETIKETVVFEKDGTSNKPVEVSVTMPKINAVLIVTNKLNASTKLSIIKSLSVVLNVEESCICILQEK